MWRFTQPPCILLPFTATSWLGPWQRSAVSLDAFVPDAEFCFTGMLCSIAQLQLPAAPAVQTKTDGTWNNVGCYVMPSLIIPAIEESRDPADLSPLPPHHLHGLRYGTRHQSAINFRLITHTDAASVATFLSRRIRYVKRRVLSSAWLTGNRTPLPARPPLYTLRRKQLRVTLKQ